MRERPADSAEKCVRPDSASAIPLIMQNEPFPENLPQPQLVRGTMYRIRAYALAMNLSKTQFAKQAGIQESVLRRLWADDWVPTRSTLEKLESAIPPDWIPGKKKEANDGANPDKRRRRAPARA